MSGPNEDTDDRLLFDPEEVASLEARNGLLQFDEVSRLVTLHQFTRTVVFTPAFIRSLNAIALHGLRRSAGQFRAGFISITNTVHRPPPPEQVPALLQDLCDYVNSAWNKNPDELASAIHLSAYLMWRLNWIHPFQDGNGRTSRAISYLALSVKLGRELAGSPTIPEQIVENRQPYYQALDAADLAWSEQRLDVTAMERLIAKFLFAQLESGDPEINDR